MRCSISILTPLSIRNNHQFRSWLKMANVTAHQLVSMAKQLEDGSNIHVLIDCAARELGIDPDEESELIESAIKLWDREIQYSYWGRH